MVYSPTQQHLGPADITPGFNMSLQGIVVLKLNVKRVHVEDTGLD